MIGMVLQLATVSYGDSLTGLAAAGTHLLDGLHHIQTLNDLSEHHMLAVKPRSGYGAQEELRTVGARACVGHRQHTRACMLPHEVLICELSSVDGLASSAVAGREVTTLAHELGDDTMESGTLIMEGFPHLAHSFLASAQGPEVLRSLRSCIGVELHDDAPRRVAPDGDVEEHLWVGHHFGCKGSTKLL